MEVIFLFIVSVDVMYVFFVEVVNDCDEISFGLMECESMDVDKGMLFDFNLFCELVMYMKNMLIFLDMLFIVDDGSIEMIVCNMVFGFLWIILFGVLVCVVLELNGGQVVILGIQLGDMVQYLIFGNVVVEMFVE